MWSKLERIVIATIVQRQNLSQPMRCSLLSFTKKRRPTWRPLQNNLKLRHATQPSLKNQNPPAVDIICCWSDLAHAFAAPYAIQKLGKATLHDADTSNLSHFWELVLINRPMFVISDYSPPLLLLTGFGNKNNNFLTVPSRLFDLLFD